MYRQVNLEDSEYYSRAYAECIRTVLLNGYPSYTMEELQAKLAAEGVADAYYEPYAPQGQDPRKVSQNMVGITAGVVPVGAVLFFLRLIFL